MFSKYTDEQTYKQIVDFKSVSQMWENCIAKYNDNIAINYNGIDFSFGQIEKEVTFLELR